MRVFLNIEGQWRDSPVAGCTVLARMKAAFPTCPEFVIGEEIDEGDRAVGDFFWVEGAFPFLEAKQLAALQSAAGDAGAVCLSKQTGVGVIYWSGALGRPARLTFAELRQSKLPAHALPARDLWLIDSARTLAEANRMAFEHNALRALDGGCHLVSPAQTWIEDGVEIGADVLIEPNAFVAGNSRIGSRCRIGAGSVLRNVKLAEDVTIRPYSVLEESEVGPGASVGPFAHVRPGTVLGAKTRVGNFVEVKNARLGDETKASHLTYLGDATIGRDCNIGAGTITCNYDGFQKHRTQLGDRVFIGSDSQLVAPVTLGDDSYVAAGSTVTRDVPENALTIARSRQVVKEGRAGILRERARRRGGGGK